MTLQEIMETIASLDGEIDVGDAMDMEVEFNTKDNEGLSLLSVYEDKGKIILNIGEKLNEKRAAYGDLH
jgi:hypothetical protein